MSYDDCYRFHTYDPPVVNTPNGPERNSYVEGRFDAQRQFYRDRFRAIYDSHPSLLPQGEQLDRIYCELRRKGKFAYYLLTINPVVPHRKERKDCVKNLIACYEKFITRKWVDVITVNIEFGKNKLHPHLHMIIHNTKRKSQVLRETLNTFKKNLDIKKNGIDCVPVQTNDLEEVQNYVNKSKKSDIKLRNKYKNIIQVLYQKNKFKKLKSCQLITPCPSDEDLDVNEDPDAVLDVDLGG